MDCLPLESKFKLNIVIIKYCNFLRSFLINVKNLIVNEEYGEILTRGPHMMTCYLNDDSFKANEWFNTGDIGKIDEFGYVYVSGRSKDVIRSGGETIRAIEIENTLKGHPAIKEICVIGREDQRLGETVCAYLTLNDNYKLKKSHNLIYVINGIKNEHLIKEHNIATTNTNYNVSVNELNAYLVKNGISAYKKPRLYIVELSGSLERTSTGKVNRSCLKKIANELYIVNLSKL